MSQRVIYNLLKELGGEGTISEITELAKTKCPDMSHPKSISCKLIALRKWGYIDYTKGSERRRSRRYRIIEDYTH